MFTTEVIPDEVRKWAVREYFRQHILARYGGNDRAAWAHLLTAVLRGRYVKRRGVTTFVSWAESPDTCLAIAKEILAGTTSIVS